MKSIQDIVRDAEKNYVRGKSTIGKYDDPTVVSAAVAYLSHHEKRA